MTLMSDLTAKVQKAYYKVGYQSIHNIRDSRYTSDLIRVPARRVNHHKKFWRRHGNEPVTSPFELTFTLQRGGGKSVGKRTTALTTLGAGSPSLVRTGCQPEHTSGVY